MKKFIKSILFVSGTFCLIAGIVGIFLPLLPTTPFLLLAAFCYARSSQRFYTWLMTNRWFGEYIKNYRDGKGIPVRIKVCKIGLLWLTAKWRQHFLDRLLVIFFFILSFVETRRMAS